MSEIVGGVLKITFGIFVTKFRDQTAKRLEDGDVTDEECRKLIVRELDDIKSKLDGLAKSILLGSICFLEEGINRLYFSLDKLRSRENTSRSEAESSTSSGQSRSADCSDLHEVLSLSDQVKNLKITSDDHYQTAKESFKEARKQATLAFCNPDLRIEDRIQATQVRIMARILESLNDLDPAVSDCLQYVQQLHDLGPIKKIFFVLNEGGMKSFLNKTRRLENANSLWNINYVLFDFARKFTKLPLGMHKFNIPTKNSLLKEYGIEARKIPYQLTLDEKLISPPYPVVSSKGEVIGKVKYPNAVRIFNGKGRSKMICDFSRDFNIIGIAVDLYDNIYIIITAREQTDVCKLLIFDTSGGLHQCPLDLEGAYRFSYLFAAVNKNQEIVLASEEGTTRVFDNAGVLVRSFHRQGYGFCLSANNEIITARYRTVYVYTENGEFRHNFEIPEDHDLIEWIAFNYLSNQIIVETAYSKSPTKYYCLLNYSVTGELNSLVRCVNQEWLNGVALTSHPKGPIALIDPTEGADFLQL